MKTTKAKKHKKITKKTAPKGKGGVKKTLKKKLKKPTVRQAPKAQKVILKNKKVDSQFGLRLRELRTGSGMSERTLELVSQIKTLRVTQLEVGETKPTAEELETLAHIFNKSSKYLAFGE